MENLTTKRKVTIMIAIMSAMLFAALNQTIVGTALPRIISELGGMEYYSWVFTIYMLTSSITALLVGKLSDIYGRKPFLLIGIFIFLVGSFLNGTSDSILQLIVYRGIQGFGGGMIMSTASTAVADLFSPRERGKWQGLMGATFGLASVFGPTLGGYIVDHADWHWVFWVFLPVGFVAFALIAWLFPKVEKQAGEKVDYIGSIFISLAMVPMLLAFSWAGQKYEWTSVEILGLFAGSIVAFIIFLFIEKRISNPIIPLHLFKNGVFTISNVVSLIVGMGMFGVIMYTPYFVQGVMGISATKSGFITMPMTISMVIASAIGGQIITKTGKYKKMAIIGLIIMAGGMYLMTGMGVDTTDVHIISLMIVVGSGLGLSFPIFTLTVQNAVEQKLLGVATSVSQLSRQLGGTIGVSIMGTILTLSMKEELKNDVAQTSSKMDVTNPQLLMNHDKLAEIEKTMPKETLAVFTKIIDHMQHALSTALSHVFLTGSIVLVFAIIITFFLKEIPLRTKN